MRPSSRLSQKIPLSIVGSTKFGRYPKISVEQTFNMIISDGWLVDYAGHVNVASVATDGQGRGIYSSTNAGKLFAVYDNGFYLINSNLAYEKLGSLGTFNGDVSIAENNARQIAICDRENLYIYDYSGNVTPSFQKVTLDFNPFHVSFQAGYFIATDPENNQWRLSDPNNGLIWPAAAPNVGAFQTKADKPLAVLPIPGSSDQIMIFGSTVTQFWTTTQYAQLFPYQLNSYFNLDYGTLNIATIAASENIICWLGANENSGPAIMFMQGGGQPVQLSNDGINFKLASLQDASDSYGFMVKQDGHVIYQLTFVTDNFTLIYDFNTQQFFTLCDENMNYHIAKKVVYFNNTYYFVSINDGNLYELNSRYSTYNGNTIPRIRVCPPVRLPTNENFVVNNITFAIEQGQSANDAVIDFSYSNDGGETFSSNTRFQMQPLAKRINRFDTNNCGLFNDFVGQFRFWSEGRFLVSDALMSIYK